MYLKNDEKVVVHSGIGFCEALTLIFIVLKLTGVINWSWWWVLAPIWLPFTIILIVIVILLFVCAVAALLSRWD